MLIIKLFLILILDIPIVKDNKLLSVLFENKVLKAILEKKLKNTDNVKTCWTKDFVVFDEKVTVTQLEKLSERN